MTHASVFLDRAERTLGFDRTSVGVPGLESTNLLTVVNSAVKDYFASFDKSGEPSKYLQAEEGYSLVADTVLDGDLAAGATTIPVEAATGWVATGGAAIWQGERVDYVEFLSRTLTTSLPNASGVNFAHDDGETISQLYEVPSDFDSLRSEEGYVDGVSVDGIPYFYTSGPPIGRTFTIYDSQSTKYLHFPRGTTGDAFLRYNAVPTVVDAETDSVDIPTKDEDYAMWAVVKYAAPLLERPDMYQIAGAEMLKILNSAHVRKNINKRPRVRPVRMGATFTRSMIFDD